MKEITIKKILPYTRLKEWEIFCQNIQNEDANSLNNAASFLESIIVEIEKKEEQNLVLKYAFNLLKIAAKKGDRDAQDSLGKFYSEGLGCKKNFNKAIYWM
jgi:TPR repeat protein